MRSHILLILVLIPVQTILCKSIKRSEDRTVMYYNAIIYTVDKDGDPNWNQNPQEAMVVQGSTIKFIGTEVDAENFAFNIPGAQYVDLNGGTVLPGFHDVHQHPLEVMSDAGAACVIDDADATLETFASKLKNNACLDNQVGTSWVLGWGHSLHMVLHHLDAHPNVSPKELLDDVLPDTPFAIMERTSHSLWVNSAALEEAGITKDTVVTGGVVKKGSDGEPNGILLENAGNYIMDIALDPGTQPGVVEANYNGVKAAIKVLNEYGITSVCDARSYWLRKNHEAWSRLLNEDKASFTVRAVLGMWLYPHLDQHDDEQILALKKLFNNDKDSLLRRSQIKLYSDGVVDATTAAMLEPYNIDLGLFPENQNVGFNYIEQSRIEKFMTALQSIDGGDGYDFHVHAIGDRGVREVLNAIENTQEKNPTSRHRITHAELVNDTDINRFSQIGVIADFQTGPDWVLPGQHDFLIDTIGKERLDSLMRVKSLVDSGAVVTLSSDWDVNDLNPLTGISNALRLEYENVDIKTAIEMYTINGAYVMRQEDKVGSLVLGKEADFVVFDRNIIQNSSPTNLKQAIVWYTYFRGHKVHG